MPPRPVLRTLVRLVFLASTVAAAGCASIAVEQGSPDPDGDLYAHALADRPAFRAGLEETCDAVGTLDEVVADAIFVGAPIYNAGSPLGCYRIYEGAAYKLLYLLGDRCETARGVLRFGLAQAEAQEDPAAQAWTMRRTFDALLGEDTVTGNTEEPPPAPRTTT
jgi:hypothetical protein